MRFSRTSWLMLTIGIFIIAFASLGFARYQQLNEQKRLEEEISVAKQRISVLKFDELYSQQEELEKQISQTISQLELAKARLSQPVRSITATDTLFSIAESCSVEIMEISSPGLTNGMWGGLTCISLPITINVEGDVPALIDFVISLNNDFTTGFVSSVEINIPEPPEASEEPEEETAEESTEEQSEEPQSFAELIAQLAKEQLEEEETEEEVEEVVKEKRPSADISLVMYMYMYQGD